MANSCYICKREEVQVDHMVLHYSMKADLFSFGCGLVMHFSVKEIS